MLVLRTFTGLRGHLEHTVFIPVAGNVAEDHDIGVSGVVLVDVGDKLGGNGVSGDVFKLDLGEGTAAHLLIELHILRKGYRSHLLGPHVQIRRCALTAEFGQVDALFGAGGDRDQLTDHLIGPGAGIGGLTGELQGLSALILHKLLHGSLVDARVMAEHGNGLFLAVIGL